MNSNLKANENGGSTCSSLINRMSVCFDFTLISSSCPTPFCFRCFSSFTVLQHLAIWGNLLAFYIINLIVSAIPSSGMYTIMFRLCKQPSYWITMFVSVSSTNTFTFVLLNNYFSCLLFFMLTKICIFVTAYCSGRHGSNSRFKVLPFHIQAE